MIQNISGRTMQIMQSFASRHLVIESRIGSHLMNLGLWLLLALTMASIHLQGVPRNLEIVPLETLQLSPTLLAII